MGPNQIISNGLANELAEIRQQLAENTARLASAERYIENVDWCIEYAERRIEAARRKLHVTWAIACLAVLALIMVGLHDDAIAKNYIKNRPGAPAVANTQSMLRSTDTP